MLNMRGEFRLAFDRLANGPEAKARSCAASDRCAPGRARSEAPPHRFAALQESMKPNARWHKQ